MIARWRQVLLYGVSALLLLYIASYIALSRKGMRTAEHHRMPGFLYAPCDMSTFSRSRAYQRLHLILIDLYHPLWLVDHALFGTPRPGPLPDPALVQGGTAGSHLLIHMVGGDRGT